MPNYQSKVTRVIDAYDLGSIGADLEAAWTDTTGNRMSLRDLTDRFNQAVLAAALDDTTASLTETDREVKRLYEDLISDAASEEVTARRELERRGIDINAVESDFVTHQTIYNYLTEIRNAAVPANDRNPVEQRIEAIEKLQGRLNSVIETSLTTLANVDQLDHDAYHVLIEVGLSCPQCGASTPLKELLRTGGCSCGDSGRN